MDKNNQILIYNHNNYHFENILKTFFKEKYRNFVCLEYIHKLLDTNELDTVDKNYYTTIPEFGVNDRKSIFVDNFYQLIDNNYTFLYEYLSFIKNVIKPLFPLEDKLIIQKTPNIRFHLPNCSNIGKRDTDKYNDVIGLHHDGEFGHPTEELNIVLPITDMFDTNSIYYEMYPNSNSNVYDYSCMNMKKNNYFIGNFNKCNHYNKINKTNKTRVSLDFRIIPFSQFKQTSILSVTSKIKFDVGKYYMII